ncbi:DNA methylase [Sinirhodobacter populi]|uniref:Methyltransferase n=1 Tax=Paenirhodobacter populi TaxID=2306993 RepID=A0A443K376_9RHOB|nr:DNA methyltransferase [Sinirhodobacter populi]RWR27219.1 DNA methylase [Sinirhodobacter populi]
MTDNANTPRNVILNADCIDAMRSFDRGSVDFILTDPPYLVNYRDRSGRKVANDDNTRWLRPAFNQMHRVLKDGGFAISFYGWNKVDLFMDAWKAAGFRVVGHIVFRKQYASSAKFLRYQHEQAYLLAKGNVSLPENPVPDVIDFPYAGNRLHPTQKPIEALRPLIEAFTKPGELVLDPFSGSGSTLAAAQQLGRDWTGIELDQGHHRTATRRLAWMQQRGKLAA